jgi:hypothetical protein
MKDNNPVYYAGTYGLSVELFILDKKIKLWFEDGSLEMTVAQIDSLINVLRQAKETCNEKALEG